MFANATETDKTSVKASFRVRMRRHPLMCPAWSAGLCSEKHSAKTPVRSIAGGCCAFVQAVGSSPKRGGGRALLQQLGVSARLAQFVAAVRWDDVPPAVRHQAK